MPSISLPKGGGAIQGIGEKFSFNSVTGTASLNIPIYTTPGRSKFYPHLLLTYDSGAGNGPFGLGWDLSIPSITRKTAKGLPSYLDKQDSDVFILSGAEDLVPELEETITGWTRMIRDTPDGQYTIERYRPRIEGLFARIERWRKKQNGETHWRSITKDNITSIYGKTSNARIADPKDNTRVFKWLLQQTYDDKGNINVYEYKEENTENVRSDLPEEKYRLSGKAPFSNRYLKHIKYGNKKPYQVGSQFFEINFDDGSEDWMFHVIFDYGEHDPITPTFDEVNHWSVRPDPFSNHRPTFDIRTYRLCRRVLMFHCFSDKLEISPYLVRSTEFLYNDSDPTQAPVACYLISAKVKGYIWNNQSQEYQSKSLPAMDFTYTERAIHENVESSDFQSLENLPVGLDGIQYNWVDLNSEGLSGIMAEHEGAWFYKRNLGKAKFGSIQTIISRPSLTTVGSTSRHFLDLAGDGQLDLVEFGHHLSGFYERVGEDDWHSFTNFPSCPKIPWEDPNLRFVDLNGDGFADILISENDIFMWYPSHGENGFGNAEIVTKPDDEEEGPALLFADATQSIYLADMCGDGLSDLVRIRNGEVCYWPNLGYGRFGAKITMSFSPIFDFIEYFDQERIRLSDIDGSGTSDLIYIGRDSIQLWFNQSGNSWSEAHQLPNFPRTDNLSTISIVDLLGNGTACIVWSSPLPAANVPSLQFIDLMGGEKPHLLSAINNNMGSETRLYYAASTKFYLEDLEAGEPWITKLPFPIHVVERVETYDHVSRIKLVKLSKFHDGFYDGPEREFRGFGLVEQWDTESVFASDITSLFDDEPDESDEAFRLPPVYIKTWFHTGPYVDGDKVSHQFIHEYYLAPDKADPNFSSALKEFEKTLLPDTVIPSGLNSDEEYEACRSLKGTMLRQEIYCLDGTDKSRHPYTVTEQNFGIECLQPRSNNQHAVFFTYSRESLSYHYERHPEDPRIAHSITLEIDKYGNALKSVAVGYGRHQSPLDEAADREKQTQNLITYTENSFTNAIEHVLEAYRAPLTSVVRTYELFADPSKGGFTPTAESGFFQPTDFIEKIGEEWKLILSGDGEVAYDGTLTQGKSRRLIEEARTLYRKNNLTTLLPLGVLDSLALTGESYRLAFTAGLLARLYKRKINDTEENLVPEPSNVLGGNLGDQGGYVDLDNDGSWWVPSGRLLFSDIANAEDETTAPAELIEAQNNFFLPRKFMNPFGQDYTVQYDGNNLLVLKTIDALQNTVLADYDHRALQPWQMTDPNGNRTQVRMDALGMVIATAVMGKKDGPVEGDSFDKFITDLTPQQIADYFDADDPRPLALNYLGTATTRVIYDLERIPTCAASISREKHCSDLETNEETKIHLTFVYSDGFGREAQAKVQAEPGPLNPTELNAPVINPRWVGTGSTIYNNKGKAVRQYETFFSATHAFGIEQHGICSTVFYDPLLRVIGTLHGNHSWEKFVFSSWHQATFDVNDTVLNTDDSTDPKLDEDLSGYFSHLRDEDYLPTWYQFRINLPSNNPERIAAEKTFVHRQTPKIAHLDTLGRIFLITSKNRFLKDADIIEEDHFSRVDFDIEGNQRIVRDGIVQNGDKTGRMVMRCDFDALSNRVHQSSMDAGERWLLNDVLGRPIRIWDSRGFNRRHAYDELRRPAMLFIMKDGSERLAERSIYGESQGVVNNHRSHVHQIFDAAGVLTFQAYDFKGNPILMKRELLSDYKGEIDWQLNLSAMDRTFHSTIIFNAFNRPVICTAPDKSIYRASYNEASLLEKVDVNLRGALETTPFITNIDYNTKGQRTKIEYANGINSIYEYDDQTFRLNHLKTTRVFTGGFASEIFVDAATIQDLHFTYDPAGNIIRISDDAIATITHDNQTITPVSEFSYDAVYRLVEAKGREHIGQFGFDFKGGLHDYPFSGAFAHPNDLMMVRHYTERYEYDAVGNFQKMIHVAGNDSWTREYSYQEPSLTEPSKMNNRLSVTSVGQAVQNYTYDVHGNIKSMPHLSVVEWDFKDQMIASSRQAVNNGTPETSFYVYDISGLRTRKVTERQNGTRKSERIYLGGFEIYREYGSNGGSVVLERETLHVMDDKQRIAMVETKTIDNGSPINEATSVLRYELANHLGSATLELDKNGELISYEEYFPFGTTSYQALNSGAEVSLKRYRHTGKERDEETGFYYHGARYAVPWLGRWISADPIGLEGGMNPYAYVSNNPIRLMDPTGTQETPAPAPKEPGFLDYLHAVFILYTFQTPENFGKGMIKKGMSATIDPVMKIYGPGGMLDKAGQKLEQGIVEGKFDTVQITEEEHRQYLSAIIDVGALLFPPLEGGGKISLPGPAVATNEGVVLATAITLDVSGAVSIGGPLLILMKISEKEKQTKEKQTKEKSKQEKSSQEKASNKKGPGEWKTDETLGLNMSEEQARYQSQISGRKASEGYYMNGRQFDAFEEGALIDAKHLENEGRFARAYENMNRGIFGDIEYLVDKGEALLEQARAQVRDAKGVPIEWHVSGKNAAAALKRLFKAYKIPIKVKHVPFIHK